MTLSRVFTDSEMEEWLADKPEVIEVYKGVWDKGRSHCIRDCSPKIGQPYEIGLCKAERTKLGVRIFGNELYWSGFHFFISLKDAKQYWRNAMEVDDCLFDGTPTKTIIIKCLIKKEWITAIGRDSSGIVLVASQAIFPHYPETEARWEDVPQEEPAMAEKE